MVAAALASRGAVLVAQDYDRAIAFANAYAPEHLSIDVEPLEPTVVAIRHASL